MESARGNDVTGPGVFLRVDGGDDGDGVDNDGNDGSCFIKSFLVLLRLLILIKMLKLIFLLFTSQISCQEFETLFVFEMIRHGARSVATRFSKFVPPN